jgi:hypothetical protein
VVGCSWRSSLGLQGLYNVVNTTIKGHKREREDIWARRNVLWVIKESEIVECSNVELFAFERLTDTLFEPKVQNEIFVIAAPATTTAVPAKWYFKYKCIYK